jgi:hypothetical protein
VLPEPPPLRWIGSSAPSGAERAPAAERGVGGSSLFQARAASSKRPDTDLKWFAWVFFAALTGFVVVFLIT